MIIVKQGSAEFVTGNKDKQTRHISNLHDVKHMCTGHM
jgi:hypothetical protein